MAESDETIFVFWARYPKDRLLVFTIDGDVLSMGQLPIWKGLRADQCKKRAMDSKEVIWKYGTKIRLGDINRAQGQEPLLTTE